MADKKGILTACLLTILLWGVHFAWFRRDTRPPVWDMALHQTYALNYLQGSVPGDDAPDNPWERSGNYPPYVHLLIAAVFWIFHPGPHIAALANIPATLILFWCLYKLAIDLAGPPAARWACILTALTPYVIWISRETVLDYWLSAWFAAALLALRKTGGFQSRGWSVTFGAILALGLLTKWFFAGIIFFPLLYIAAAGKIWRYPARCIHLLDSVIIAGAVAGLWYIPNIPRLVQYFHQNAAVGALEGEPPVLSFQSFIYYFRLLEGYQLFAILFALLLLAFFFCWKNKLIRDWGFLAAAILGGWLVLTLLRTKDPRFTLPLLGPLAIIPGVWIQSWTKTWLNSVLQAMLAAVLCVQAYAANFGLSRIPEKMVLLRGYQGSLRWDWNLYLQDYFGIFGKPKMEDWRQREILRAIAVDSAKRSVTPALAMIPDLPWFSDVNFGLYARMDGKPFRIVHLKSGPGGINAFDGYNYVVMTEREQGMSWTTSGSESLNKVVVDNPAVFRLVSLNGLPNGDSARLYYIERFPVPRSPFSDQNGKRETGNGERLFK
jgi:4-amino-4-deoxy-L-arabinose transferase-like glycosyltransferase